MDFLPKSFCLENITSFIWLKNSVQNLKNSCHVDVHKASNISNKSRKIAMENFLKMGTSI